jgi:hypothetical protein
MLLNLPFYKQHGKKIEFDFLVPSTWLTGTSRHRLSCIAVSKRIGLHRQEKDQNNANKIHFVASLSCVIGCPLLLLIG